VFCWFDDVDGAEASCSSYTTAQHRRAGNLVLIDGPAARAAHQEANTCYCGVALIRQAIGWMLLRASEETRDAHIADGMFWPKGITSRRGCTGISTDRGRG